LERGAEALIIVAKNPEKLRVAALELGNLGKLITSNTDITDPAQLDILLAQIDGKFRDLDLLVNSAGVFLPKPFLEHTLEDYDQYLNLNRGTFFITQRVARNMVKRGRGGAIVIKMRVINERSRARRRESHDERSAWLDHRGDVARRSAPPGDAVVVALQFHRMPMY
jgi:NADP-dependent 3-hydroxy acid dehydrogenase YdfG